LQSENQGIQKQIRATVWKPLPSTAGQKAIAAAVALALCSAAAWIYLLAQPVGIASIFAAIAGAVGVPLTLIAGAIAAGSYSMRYRIESGQLSISCLWLRERIPLGQIDGVYGGRRLGKGIRVNGLSLPGFFVGTTSETEVGTPKFYGTALDPSSVLLVTAEHRAYAITPANLEAFRNQLVSRLDDLSKEDIANAAEPVSEGTLIPSVPLLRDRVCLALMVAALAAIFVSFAYVGIKLGGLPALIPLHFTAAGQPDMIVPRESAFRMPIIGMVILGVNSLVAAAIYSWQRDASRVLAGATLLIELVALVAVLRVVH
jgi:hypothetical protein